MRLHISCRTSEYRWDHNTTHRYESKSMKANEPPQVPSNMPLVAQTPRPAEPTFSLTPRRTGSMHSVIRRHSSSKSSLFFVPLGAATPNEEVGTPTLLGDGPADLPEEAVVGGSAGCRATGPPPSVPERAGSVSTREKKESSAACAARGDRSRTVCWPRQGTATARERGVRSARKGES